MNKKPADRSTGLRIGLLYLVERRGLEPLTLCLQSRCSPN